jgi:nitroreductase
VRTYRDVAVTDAEVRALLELTGRAPSAFNLQPWRLFVVRDQADQVKQLLGIPAHATITALVAIGRGADDGFRSHRHSVDRVATFR